MMRVLFASLLGCSFAQGGEVEVAFSNFARRFNKEYSSDVARSNGFAAFEKSYWYVKAQNAKNLSYKLEINEFADQTPQDVSARLGLSLPSSGKLFAMNFQHLGTDEYSGAPLPKSVDWVAKGAVTEVRNQGGCGACWTYSTMGALEGAWQIATGELVSFSEQQLLDCSKNGGNAGCSGGGMDSAFQYLEDHVVCTYDSYKYTGKEGTCAEPNCTVAIPKGRVAGFKDVPAANLQALMEAVVQQPVSVAIEADQLGFQLYQGGILSKECGDKLDHGVLVVGYGTENGTDYWKVKNSWGPQWGEKGYIRIQRGASEEGMCGIKLGAVYPVISTENETILV